MALYRLARVCTNPKCRGDLNLVVTGALREMLVEADPGVEIMRVKCKWETNRDGPCGESVSVTAYDVQEGRFWSDG